MPATAKSRLLTAFLVATSLTIASASSVVAQSNGKITDADGLRAKAQAEGSVRLILTLAGASGGRAETASSSTSSSVPATTTAGSTDQQSQILARHVSSDRAGRMSVRVIPGTPWMALNVTQSELAVLSADDTVVSIHEDGQMQPILQDSVPLIQMTGASGAYSKGATGAGYMVAVFDTGVEYAHQFITPRITNATCF